MGYLKNSLIITPSVNIPMRWKGNITGSHPVACSWLWVYVALPSQQETLEYFYRAVPRASIPRITLASDNRLKEAVHAAFLGLLCGQGITFK